MELQQLRYVVALAQEFNFQRASKKSHVSQPTLSQQIKKLEEELGTVLFERSPQQVKLTATGEKFLPYAVGILDTLQKGINAVAEDTREVSGRLRVGAIPTIGPYLLPQIIIQLKKTAPKVILELYEETTSILVEHLKDGKLDLCLLALPIQDSGIVSRSIGKEEFYLAVAKRHRLAAKKSVTSKDILSENLLILQEGHCFSDQALEYCHRSRQDGNVIFQGSSLTSVMKLAETENGITFVPKMAVNSHSNPELVFIPFKPPKPEREIGIIWRISAPLNRAHKLFMETSLELFQVQNKNTP